MSVEVYYKKDDAVYNFCLGRDYRPQVIEKLCTMHDWKTILVMVDNHSLIYSVSNLHRSTAVTINRTEAKIKKDDTEIMFMANDKFGTYKLCGIELHAVIVVTNMISTALTVKDFVLPYIVTTKPKYDLISAKEARSIWEKNQSEKLKLQDITVREEIANISELIKDTTADTRIIGRHYAKESKVFYVVDKIAQILMDKGYTVDEDWIYGLNRELESKFLYIRW